MKIEVVVGNIIMQPDVDAVVNSANANLRLGSGVAGAIHTAAGPELEVFCKPFAPLGIGAALITPGFNLANPWIIHLRSAHFILDIEPERYMANALTSILGKAKDNEIRSLAMPAIGIGVFKFPAMLAAQITAKALREFEKKWDAIELVRICVVSEDLKEMYQSAIDQETKAC